MDEFIATFHIDWKLMLAQAVNFGLVFLVFYLLAAKPLSKLMKDRTGEISKGLDDAKRSNELLQKATEEYEKNTIKLRQLSINAQAELQKDLEKVKEKNLERIKADNDEWAKKRVQQMEIDKKNLVESAKGEVISLVVQAAEKILGGKEHISEKDLKELKNI